jgi:hypothetical protein
MPTESDFFPSKYLRAADLKGRKRATIDRITTETFENDGRKQTKPVIEFKEQDIKPMVCNKTNFGLIAALCGGETDAWSGKQIELHREMVSFKGKVTESVRVARPDQDFNDEMPFK